MAAIRKRAVRTPENEIGMARFNLYKEAITRINAAIDQGFFLEAITLVKSLISDRLESRLTLLKGEDFSFRTLGELISETRNRETDPKLRELVIVISRCNAG
ncbi:MAG: hypothetical protein WCK35_06905 [Chloroflexota bacterium]